MWHYQMQSSISSDVLKNFFILGVKISWKLLQRMRQHPGPDSPVPNLDSDKKICIDYQFCSRHCSNTEHEFGSKQTWARILFLLITNCSILCKYWVKKMIQFILAEANDPAENLIYPPPKCCILCLICFIVFLNIHEKYIEYFSLCSLFPSSLGSIL